MHIKIYKIETNANEVKFSNEKLLLFYLMFAQIEIIEIYRQKGKGWHKLNKFPAHFIYELFIKFCCPLAAQKTGIILLGHHYCRHFVSGLSLVAGSL